MNNKKITQEIASQKLDNMIREKDFIFYKTWKEQRYEAAKIISTTEKGDLGEDFLKNLLLDLGFNNVELIEGRRGSYDVTFSHNNKKICFEVKTATMDTNHSFQFNGVRYDRKYTHLFCLGISPNEIGFIILNKKDLDNETLVPMQSGTNSTFKLTKRREQLISFDNFENEISDL